MVLFVATPAPKSMKEPERHPALLRLLEAALAVRAGAAEGSARASAERTSPKKTSQMSCQTCRFVTDVVVCMYFGMLRIF